MMNHPALPGIWFPLSFSQRSRWFAYRLDPANRGRHNNAFSARVHGQLGTEALADALKQLVARHPMLRAHFRERDGEPEQCVVDNVHVQVTEERIAPAETAQLAVRVRADFVQPFDLARSALVRAVLYRIGAEESVLSVTFDHLGVDGWSYWQLLDELGGLLADPHAVHIQTDRRDYVDHITWQRNWLNDERGEAQWRYWREQLKGPIPLLQLPTDRQPPARSTGQQRSVTITLDDGLARQLRTLARSQSTSLFVTLLTAYYILLHRHTGQNDIVVGTPLPGRSEAEWDHVVGDFANPVALRVNVLDGMTSAQALRMVRHAAAGALANQDYPFSRLVERLEPGQVMHEHPLFQTTFTFQKARHGRALSCLFHTSDDGLAVPWGGVELTPFPAHQTGVGSQAILALEAIELEQGIRCDVKYDPEVYDEATVVRIAARYRRLLAAVATDPDQDIGSVGLLDDAERKLVLGGFHAPRQGFPESGLVHHLFARQAAAAPQRTALVSGSDEISYGELNRRANRIAHRLLSLGASPDDRVAVCAGRGVDMVAGILGVLKAGAAYVPLDPAYPAERLAFTLGDCAPVAVLAQAALAPQLPTLAVPVLLLDGADEPGQPEHDPVVPGLTSSHLAYVIYTSGSTGQPKGVMVEHRNVARLLTATEPWFRFGPDDVWTLFHSFAFDFSVWELWTPLATGGKVVLVSALCARANDEFYALLCREGVTVLNQTPTAFRQLIAAQARSEARHRLRWIIFGGEALEPRMLLPWMERNDPTATRLVNMYGITETTVHVSYREIGLSDVLANPGSVIGVPIPDLTVRILDSHLAPVPVGVAGEIYVGGAGLARGYLNRPDLTAARFIRDPYDAAPGARLYRTGDLARWRSDGDIEYLGRNDFQVKIRGFRIELGEIEAKLADCRGVCEAVVVARAGEEGETRLVGYVVATDGAALSVVALREELAGLLPAHMVPAAVVQIDAFPFTPNGKLDRTALPEPGLAAFAHAAYAPPQGETEYAMAAIWQELLGASRIGRHDNFFDIGGHSLLATRLLARIRQTFHAELPLRELFENATLEQLARRADAARAAPCPAIVPLPRDARSSISLGQQRLWFLAQFDPAANAAYVMPGAWTLKGRLDKPALLAALNAIVARHEVLRTQFAAVDGVPVQVVADAQPFALIERDFRHVAADGQQAAVDALCAAEIARPFDLARGPLFRGVLLMLDENVHILLLMQHHIVSDGWSVRLLFAELAALYGAFAVGRPDPLAPLALQYGDFAQWQRNLLDGPLMQDQAAYWQRQLADAPVSLQLPTDRQRPLHQDYMGGRCEALLASAQTQALSALAQRHGVTPFMVFTAAWAALLARLSGQNDIVIGTPSANRRHTEWESLIGFFVNTLALRIRLDDDPTTAQLLAQVKATVLAAQAHQDLPFEQVVEAVNPPRTMAHSPIFQVMLAMDNTPGSSEAALPGLHMEPVQLSHHTAQCDLSLTLRMQDNGLHAALQYASALFDHATAARFLRHWKHLLVAMTADEDASVSRLSLLDADDLATLARFNATAMPWPREKLLHQAFEEHAATKPDQMALTWHAERLSYGALNQRANRIAHRLLALGVRPDDRVALCVERTPDMVAALLGILKAGAAYVPLDPAYPRERLAYILDDCAPAALLCQVATMEKVGAGAISSIILDHDTELARQPLHDPRPEGLQPAHLAYLIYTSGSTGQPKGVMVEHRNAVAFIAWAQATFTEAQLDLSLFSTSINFDLAVFELFLPLSSGRPLALVQNVLCSNDELSNVSLINTVPSAIDVLLKAGWVPPSAKLVNLAGEPLRRHLVERLFASTDVQTVGNLYGPSETTTYSTYVLMPRSDGFVQHIGRPIGNTQVHILDTQAMPVPVGVVGELYIGGAGVARGYLNRPALTAERFIADRFSTDPQARLYRTGDLGRWLPCGNIQYVGRNDFQVKIRGFRIELGEIETKLAACKGVQEAVVVAREDGQGEPRLVAYAVTRPGAHPQPARLRAALAAQLPGYMVPAALVLLEAWPLTPNGKLDRAALPQPNLTAARLTLEEPRAGQEAAMAALWQALLDVPWVGRSDNFFEIGGHSLLAVQLVARIGQTLHAKVALADVFAHPTLAALAATVAKAAPDERAPIPLVADSPDYPMSHIQLRLWLAQRLDPCSTAYGIPVVLALPASTDASTMRGVLAALVARHAALRTVFALRDGAPVQVILPSLSVPIDEVAAADAGALARLTADNARIVFDLEHGPLFGARLVTAWDDQKFLLWNMHHIIADGMSLAILKGEILALLGGATTVLPPLPIRYVDFAAWDNAMLQDRAGADRRFWLEQLGSELPVANLPYDFPAADRTGGAGSACRLHLAAATLRHLQALATRHDATLFMVLASGFTMLLAKMTGQHEVLIGTPVAGRVHPDTQQIVGCFINTLMLRNRIDPADTVATLLRKVRATTLQALAHQSYPFERLVEELGLGRFPVAPVSLNLLPVEGGDAALADGGASHRVLEQDVKYDLNLYVSEHGDGLQFDFHYRSACFKAETIEYVLTAYLDLLAAMAEADDRPCAGFQFFELPQLNVRLPQVIDAHRFVRIDDDAIDQSLPARFAQQVALHGERIAVRTRDATLTYRELDAASDNVGRLLVARDGACNSRVALLFGHDASMLAGLLGALKASKTYVPLDPGYPQARLAYMLDNSQVRVILTNHEHLDLAQRLSQGRTIVDVDQSHAPDTALPAVIDPDTPAYILYTSGSTGQPKGVVQTHRHALYFCKSYTNNLHIDAADRVALLASYSFDAAVMDIFGALMNGAALYPIDPKRTARQDLLAWMSAESISIYHSTPTLYRHLFGVSGQRASTAVRLVVLGGELVTPDDVARFEAVFDERCVLVNGYGPTESTLALQNFITHGSVVPATGVPAGYPVQGVRIALDRPGVRPHAFQRGEIVIESDHVALGYWGNEAQTARVFGTVPEIGRYYRTGDIGRFSQDGSLVVEGRTDNQVKIRGFRIELSEIEGVLKGCDGVREAIVTARGNGNGTPRLVAYVTSDENAGLAIPALRSHLLAVLPDYMIPSAYVIMDRFPQTPSGKVDRAALPEPDGNAVPARDFAASEGAAEQAMAGLWSELLGLERVGRYDHFFELGGDSLMAVTLVERLRQLGLSVPVRDVFARPVLADLAAVATPLDDAGAGAAAHDVSLVPSGAARLAPAMVPLARLDQDALDRLAGQVDGGVSNVQDVYRLAPLQEGILFHHRLQAEGDAYLLHIVLEFGNRAALDAFLSALQRVIERHDILRSAMHWEGLPHPVQVVCRQAPLPVHEVELPAHEARAALLRATDPGSARLDVRRAPLLAATVGQDGSGAWLLALLSHHLVCDHVTLELIMEEVRALLNGGSAGLAAAVPFRRFIAQLADDDLDAHAAYFRSRLEDVTMPSAPFDVLEVRADGAAVTESRRALEAALDARVRGAARRHQVSPAALCHLAWAAVVGRFCGQDDVVFGTVLLGRMQGIEQGQRMVGMFINSLPLRIRLQGTVAQALQSVHEELVELLQHEQAPLSLAQRCSTVAPPLPLFTTMFNYRHSSTGRRIAGEEWGDMRLVHAQERTNYPVTVSVDDFRDGFELRVLAVDGVDGAQLAHGLESALDALVGALEAEPASPMAALEIFDAAQRDLFAQTVNDGRRGYDRAALMHELTGRRDVAERGYAPPRGTAEQAMAGLWGELLGLERVGRYDHFFELGGDSLMTVTLVERLRQLGLSVPVRDVFARPVLADLAAVATPLDDAGAGAAAHDVSLVPSGAARLAPAMVPLARLDQDALDRLAGQVDGGVSNVQDVYRLAPLQEGILFHHRLQAEGDAYLLHIVLEFGNRAALDAFLSALQRVIERHDILRSAMHWEGLPHPVQVVCRQAPLPVHEVELPAHEARAALLRATDPGSARLDVRRAPLLAATVGQDGSGAWLLALLSHHLVCDHVTLELIMEEVRALLNGGSAGLAAAVPFRRFIAQLADDDLDAHAAYFRSRLEDVTMPSAPFDVLEVRADGAAVTESRRALEAALDARVRGAARRHQVSPAALCHLAWAAVVGRFCGQDDVVFGTVLLGRMQGIEQGQRMVGMFINSLPLRIRLQGTVAQALQSVHEELVELLQHEQAPLSLAQRCSTVAPPLPLFTTMFNYRHSSTGRRIAGEEWGDMRLVHAQERTNYPVTVSVDDFRDGFELRVLAVDGVDGAQLAHGLESALDALVGALEAEPASPMAALEIFDAAQRELLTKTVNDTRRGYDRAALIHELIERQAAARPHAPALSVGHEHISYAELNRRANLVAHRLQALGVAPEMRVALCMARGMDMVAGLLGILKAGGVYVPLDPGYPAARMDYMLADSAPAVVLCGAAWPARFAHAAKVLVLDDVIDDGADPGNLCPRALGLHSEHLAYLIYTSGSTGQPKGVMIQHRPVINLIDWVNRRFEVGSADKLLFTTSICFDLSVYDMFGMLAAGGVVRIALEDELADPERLLAILASEEITFWDSAPAAFSRLQPALARMNEVSTHLRLAFFSGDWIALELPAVVRRAFPRCQVIGLGGATEATVWSNYYPIRQVETHWTSIPYGKPIANARYYVLDQHLRPCPVNVAGDLYIGGECLSAGYWNKPELSAERFLPDPFAGGDARMYRSGDRARYWSDGNLEFLGRLDGQVKVRGYRIELGEIEARLGALDGVREAVVLARPAGPRDKRLVAYLVAGRTLEPAQLRAALLTTLPEYMVPSAYVQLDRLPLTANGKVDRAALPEPDGQAVPARSYAMPQGTAEQALAALWCELLGLGQVGRHDHFFELGGHSLTVVTLIERLRQQGLSVQVLDVFTRPVLADLAVMLVTAEPEQPGNDAVDWRAGLSAAQIAQITAGLPGGLENVEDAYRLAPLQEAMLVHHMMGGGADAYLMRVVLEIDSAARSTALLDALQIVIDHQPVLRTTLRWRELDEPLQVVLRSVRLKTVWLDVPEGECGAAAIERRSDPRGCHMALDEAPLIRAFAVQLPDGRCRVALLYHHIICDHVTLEILMAQIAQVMRDRSAMLPRSRAYRHYVERWRAQSAQAHRAYFSRQLSDFAVPTAPFGLIDTQGAGENVMEVYRQVPDALARRVDCCARQLGTSPAVLFHVAWAKVLTRLCHRDDVVFGTVLSGRLQGESGGDRALGVFINALPLRIRFDAHSAEALVLETRQSLLDLIPHEQASYALAQQCSGIPGSMPLFTVLLNYRHGARAADGLGGAAGLQGIRTVAGYSRTNFPLSLDVDEHDGRFGIGIECIAPLAPARVADYMFRALDCLADALESRCTAPFISVPLLDAPSARPVARAWDAIQPGTGMPGDRRLRASVPGIALLASIRSSLGRFKEQPAVVDEDGTLWTYAQLDAFVDALALQLRGSSVAPHTPVGIQVPDTFRRLGCVLALLAHGCAVELQSSLEVEDAGVPAAPRIVITDAACPAAAGGVPLLDGLALCGDSRQRPHPVPSNVLYVEPAHGASGTVDMLSRSVGWLVRTFEIKAGERLGVASGLAGGRWLRDVFAALHVGATIVCAPHATASGSLHAWIAHSGLHVFSGDAAHLRALGRAKPADAPMATLRRLIIGGGAMFARDVNRWRAAFPEIRISHVFGVAASGYTDLCWHDDLQPLPSAFAPLGRPIVGTQILLCGLNGEPMFPDEPGRLCLRMAAPAPDPHDPLCNPLTSRLPGGEKDELYACAEWVACDASLLVTIAHQAGEIRGGNAVPGIHAVPI
jgi:amino acid adenylation domain-containing protein